MTIKICHKRWHNFSWEMLCAPCIIFGQAKVVDYPAEMPLWSIDIKFLKVGLILEDSL